MCSKTKVIKGAGGKADFDERIVMNKPENMDNLRVELKDYHMVSGCAKSHAVYQHRACIEGLSFRWLATS